jgi:hypothetical protein
MLDLAQVSARAAGGMCWPVFAGLLGAALRHHGAAPWVSRLYPWGESRFCPRADARAM